MKWEYKAFWLTPQDRDLMVLLNEQGEQGWEAVTFVPAMRESVDILGVGYVLLKRRPLSTFGESRLGNVTVTNRSGMPLTITTEEF